MIAHSKCVMVIVLTHSLTELSVHTPHYENVPFEVPKGWVWTTLGSISNYGTSINVQVGDIDSNEWILELEDIEKDTAKIIQHLSKKERFLNGTRHKFQKGDILYSKLRTYLNKVLVASNGGFCSTEIMPFGVLSNEYICHVLCSNHFLDYTLRCGYGVKMPRLSTNDACKGMIPLPPLAEQQRIVTEIEKWFSLIDQIEQGKDDLHSIVKQTKSKILDLAIHGELVPQDPNDEPAIELLKRINPSFTPCDNGHYPVGWIDVILGDIFYHNTGKALQSLTLFYLVLFVAVMAFLFYAIHWTTTLAIQCLYLLSDYVFSRTVKHNNKMRHSNLL